MSGYHQWLSGLCVTTQSLAAQEAAALEAARRMHAAAMYGHQPDCGSPHVSLARVFDW